MHSSITAPRALAALAAAAACVMVAVPAAAHAAAPPGLVTSNPADGMNYRASHDTTIIRVSLAGSTFTVDDTVPLTAGIGCVAVAGDPTKATCAAPAGKRFEVYAGDGNDTVFNFTTVGMVAVGGNGHDTLHGSVTAPDELSGSVGDDKLVGNNGNDRLFGEDGNDMLVGGYGSDTLRGGADNDTIDGGPGDRDDIDGGIGDDQLDGGAGLNDLVTYEFRTGIYGVKGTIGGDFGIGGEWDTVSDEVENVRGTQNHDVVIGNDRDNRLEGYVGSDILVGMGGADTLITSDGDDVLAGYTLGNIPDEDGARDRLLANGGNDECHYSTSDPDFASGCDF